MRRILRRQQGRSCSFDGPSSAGRLPSLPTSSCVSGRKRHPASRSRSMSVLSGHESESHRLGYPRSLSFSDGIPETNGRIRKSLSECEEDEAFRSFTKKLYAMFVFLAAVIMGLVVYAYIYNTG